MKEELTTVLLTPHEALQFIQFQKHFNLIGLLDSVGAFNIEGGSVTIHFDKAGQIKSVDKHQYYKA